MALVIAWLGCGCLAALIDACDGRSRWASMSPWWMSETMRAGLWTLGGPCGFGLALFRWAGHLTTVSFWQERR